jgi:ABC-type sugar transport system ATPase subunit
VGTHVELADISKSFGGVRALDEISLKIARGSIHALVGENGAGKSTLGKILAGVIAPDRGQLLIDGEPVTFHSPGRPSPGGSS